MFVLKVGASMNIKALSNMLYSVVVFAAALIVFIIIKMKKERHKQNYTYE